MKKLLIVLICLLMYSTQIMAANDYDVRFTVHNMGYNTNASAGITTQRNFASVNPANDQVCIFCHTPHNASPSVPLWNKVYDPTAYNTYRLYTSSKSLTNTVKTTSKIAKDSESMLCLSCHDGKTSINVIHNSRTYKVLDPNNDKIIAFDNPGTEFDISGNATGGQFHADIGAVRDSNGLRVATADSGTNLTDDHPVGFSYADAANEASTKLNTITYAKQQGIRFFGAKRDRLECSSCHNPHVFYGYGKSGATPVAIAGATADQILRAPFLVRNNVGSALCLSCHNK